ncbi:MAG: serine protease [Acidobacteria bacterium]|nr:serine protease [Acidobacteriota bacterium]
MIDLKLYENPPPINKEMAHIKTKDIIMGLKEFSRGRRKDDTDEKHERGIIEDDDRIDFYELEDALKKKPVRTESKNKEDLYAFRDYGDMEKIKKNIEATAVICSANCLEINEGFATLKVKTFKERYNLCECERFANQLSIVGNMCTCFLVKDDVVATAGHFLNAGKAEDLRVLFGFKMENNGKAITKVPIANVYNVKEIISKSHDQIRNAPDWGLLRLDRKVKDTQIIQLSMKDDYCDQKIYTIGYPMGLPVKFATGAQTYESRDQNFIRADLDIFMGNSGSPVFDRINHELIGIVARGYSKDFRNVNGCWVSIIYPTPKPDKNSLSPKIPSNVQLSECTRISAFRDLLKTC